MLSVRNVSPRFVFWVALFALSFGAGCTQEPAPSPPTQPTGPLVTPQAATPSQPAADVLSSSIPGAGTSAAYQASFNGGQLERIEETRSGGAGPGSYEFRGARLLKYSGPSTVGDAQIEIELNLQGAVVATRSSAGTVTAEEIGSVRSRAQLLRSHALAQKAVRSHKTQ